MKGYAHSQSAAGIVVDSMYMGRAVEGNGLNIGDVALHGNVDTSLIAAVHWISTSCVLISVMISLFTIPCISFQIGFVNDKVKNSLTLKSNILASLTACTIITGCIFAVDVTVLVIENDRDSLPSYYPDKPYSLFISTIFFLITSLSFLVTGMTIMVMFLCISYKNDRTNDDFFESILFVAAIVLIFGSTAISLTFHLPSVIMAWSTDPLYAGKVAIFYEIIIALYFYTFYFIYYFTCRVWMYIFDPDNEGELLMKEWYNLHFLHSFCKGCRKRKHKRNSSNCHKCLFTAILLLISPILLLLASGIIIPITVFVVRIPVSNSIEGASEGVTIFYNALAAVFGGIIAFKIGWRSVVPSSSKKGRHTGVTTPGAMVQEAVNGVQDGHAEDATPSAVDSNVQEAVNGVQDGHAEDATPSAVDSNVQEAVNGVQDGHAEDAL